jgi:protein TonB
MKAGRASRRWPESARWGVCFALALGFHAAGAAALLAKWNESSDLVANAPVIMIDLTPVAVAPDVVQSELPPGPQQAQAESEPEPDPVKPVERHELPPESKAEPQLAMPPPPKPAQKPKEERPKQRHARPATAPSTAENRAERPAGPAPGASSRNPYAVSSWKSLLVSQLERSKRYPTEARARGEEGVAQIAFNVDRRGVVHDAHIVRSSGSTLLDREALATVERAQPMPPPPRELPGTQIAIVVPIRYNIR